MIDENVHVGDVPAKFVKNGSHVGDLRKSQGEAETMKNEINEMRNTKKEPRK